jgi:type IV secretory pathway TrbD component
MGHDKTVALATKLICTVLKYLLAYLIYSRYGIFMATALVVFLTKRS